MCNHLFVSGLGMLGDALTCEICGLSKYPESLPLGILALARVQNRVILEDSPQHAEHLQRAVAARACMRKLKEELPCA